MRAYYYEFCELVCLSHLKEGMLCGLLGIDPPNWHVPFQYKQLALHWIWFPYVLDGWSIRAYPLDLGGYSSNLDPFFKR